MKRIFVVTMLLAIAVTFASAQQRQRMSAEERAKNQTESMEKDLSLTADQKTKVQAINLDIAKKMDEQMQAASGDRDAMMAKMQELNTDRNNQLKAVLTDDQFKKYTDMQAQQQNQMRQRREQRN